MTGREKIEAALSPQGAPEIPAVICYDTIFIRDHWKALTKAPWWHQFSPDMGTQLAWRREVISRIGQDWLRLPFISPRPERENTEIEMRDGEVFRVNRQTGHEEHLTEPPIGGEPQPGVTASSRNALAETRGEIERQVPLPDDPGKTIDDGSDDLAKQLLAEFGETHFPYCRVPSPLWCCYDLWGFENMMIMSFAEPELVSYAAERWLESCLRDVRRAAALGARGIWIEECFTDMISPASFTSLNLPTLRRLIREIRLLEMKSIYYYCGNPMDRLDLLLASGADALALEEGKKGFEIDLGVIAEDVRGECTLFGNLDAVGVLQNGTEAALKAAIRSQIAAGRLNRGRFVMSLGSPVTPSTPVDRVRRYCDLAHEMGRLI
jgi:hypothetical protein